MSTYQWVRGCLPTATTNYNMHKIVYATRCITNGSYTAKYLPSIVELELKRKR